MVDRSKLTPDQPARKRHPNWKGGRIIDPRGYALVYVGKGHHLADVRGYAYEHRLVAEKKLGRRLRPGEEVHHKKSTSDNRPSQIVVAPDRLHHKAMHRKRKDLRGPTEPNATVACACGCEGRFLKYDPTNRPRKFLPGHWRRGKTYPNPLRVQQHH